MCYSLVYSRSVSFRVTCDPCYNRTLYYCTRAFDREFVCLACWVCASVCVCVCVCVCVDGWLDYPEIWVPTHGNLNRQKRANEKSKSAKKLP